MTGSRASLFLSLALATASAANAARPSDFQGVWINPKGSVAVRTRTCGRELCGWIVWANGEAAQDARDEGVDRLVGTQVLRDYRPSGDGSWRGTVYVPDKKRSFNSVLTMLDPNSLKISGCLIGHFLCKSQIWHRH